MLQNISSIPNHSYIPNTFPEKKKQQVNNYRKILPELLYVGFSFAILAFTVYNDRRKIQAIEENTSNWKSCLDNCHKIQNYAFECLDKNKNSLNSSTYAVYKDALDKSLECKQSCDEAYSSKYN